MKGRQGTRDRRTGGRGRGWYASAESKASSERGFVFAGGGCSDSHMPYDHNSRKGRTIGWICTGLGQTKKSSSDSPIGQPTTVLDTNRSINDGPADQSPTCHKIPCWSRPAPPVRPGSFDPPWRWANGQLRRERRRRRGHDDHAPTATASVREVRLWWE